MITLSQSLNFNNEHISKQYKQILVDNQSLYFVKNNLQDGENYNTSNSDILQLKNGNRVFYNDEKIYYNCNDCVACTTCTTNCYKCDDCHSSCHGCNTCHKDCYNCDSCYSYCTNCTTCYSCVNIVDNCSQTVTKTCSSCANCDSCTTCREGCYDFSCMDLFDGCPAGFGCYTCDTCDSCYEHCYRGYTYSTSCSSCQNKCYACDNICYGGTAKWYACGSYGGTAGW